MRFRCLGARFRGAFDSEVSVHSAFHDVTSLIPVSHAANFAERVPTARVEVFENAGHFPHVDEPVRFATLLADFVATTEPARLDASDFRDRLVAGA